MLEHPVCFFCIFLHWKPSCLHPYASGTGKSSHQPDRKSSVPAWKQIRDRLQVPKGRGKASTYQQKLAKVSKQQKLKLLCTLCHQRQGLSGQENILNPSPVIAGKKDLCVTSKRTTVNLHVNSCVVSPVHFVKGHHKGKAKSRQLPELHRNKICERCFLCWPLEFCKLCNKCLNCYTRPTCRGQIAQVLGEMRQVPKC